MNKEQEIIEAIRTKGEKDGDVSRIWLDLNGVCNIEGHTDVMCAHLGCDGILTFQVNTPDDNSTIFVRIEELPEDVVEKAYEQVMNY